MNSNFQKPSAVDDRRQRSQQPPPIDAQHVAFLQSDASHFNAGRVHSFVQQIHRSLDPTKIAYLAANAGRQIIGCDRLSVGVRRGQRIAVEAVSGTDVVERRSSVVQRMCGLLDAVAAWGDTVVYAGTRDEALPPRVVAALDAYLAACPSRFVVILPLQDNRERDSASPPRSLLLLECFQPPADPVALHSQLEAVGMHTASALYNALEHDGVPMRWLWRRLKRIYHPLSERPSSKWMAGFVIFAAVSAALTFIPYPYRVEARGKLLPTVRRWVYSPIEGRIVHFEESIQPGSVVNANQPLMLVYDVQLEARMIQLSNDIAGAQQAEDALAAQESQASSDAERLRLSAEKRQKESFRNRKTQERRALRERIHADDSRPGHFWIKAPIAGTILNSDFRETFTNRQVKPSEPLIRIGDKSHAWEAEVHLPQRAITEVLLAFQNNSTAPLVVDLQLKSASGHRFQGVLAHDQLTSQASTERESGDAGPTLRASVRLAGDGIADSDRIPAELLVSGTELRAKVNCGNRPLGFVLFHGVWDFLQRLTF